MGSIEVQIDIAAPRSQVWAAIEDISTHTNWMRDAVAIRFTSPETSGVGATFDCDTKVGPLKVTDRLEVTEWRPGECMAIRHVGLVIGTGRFELASIDAGHTRFVWTEVLHFPRRKGGRVTAALAAPVLRRIWKGNLVRLRDLIERG